MTGRLHATASGFGNFEGVGRGRADSRQAIEAYLNRNPGLSPIASAGGTVVGAILWGAFGVRPYVKL